jgi:hypothetical protein
LENLLVARDSPHALGGRPSNLARQIRKSVIYCMAVTDHQEGPTRMDNAPVEDELASKHAALHALIAEEENRPHPDEDLLHRLKKEKLKLKDAMLGH